MAAFGADRLSIGDSALGQLVALSTAETTRRRVGLHKDPCLMTVDGRATRKTDGLADRPAGTISPGHVAASTKGAISDVSASSEGRANDVPTPFYDLLTAMIKAQALENEIVRRHESATGNDPVSPRKAVGGSGRSHGSNASDAMQNLRRIANNTDPGVANHPWRVLAPRLNACIAGLIVTAAIGGVIYFLQVSMRQPHVVAAVDEPSKAKSPVVAPVSATAEPVPQVEERGGPGQPGVDGERAIERGIKTGSIVASHSDDPRVAPSVTAQPIENLASDVEKPQPLEGAPGVQSSSAPTHLDTIAPATNPADKPSPQATPSQPLSDKTGSTIGPTNDTVALRTARAIIHVNMRAGPGNDKAVVMTIPAGSPVQVVKCQHWCEVIFAGQQGWVYKGFIGTSPTPGRP